jgi:hypothetical protein
MRRGAGIRFSLFLYPTHVVLKPVRYTISRLLTSSLFSPFLISNFAHRVISSNYEKDRKHFIAVGLTPIPRLSSRNNDMKRTSEIGITVLKPLLNAICIGLGMAINTLNSLNAQCNQTEAFADPLTKQAGPRAQIALLNSRRVLPSTN